MNDRDFMMHPANWPETSFWSKRIYLKRGKDDLAQLAYLKGRYAFVQESSPFTPNMDTLEWGDGKLIDKIISNGWLVD